MTQHPNPSQPAAIIKYPRNSIISKYGREVMTFVALMTAVYVGMQAEGVLSKQRVNGEASKEVRRKSQPPPFLDAEPYDYGDLAFWEEDTPPAPKKAEKPNYLNWAIGSGY